VSTSELIRPEQERWLLARGLPSVLLWQARLRGFLGRTAPFILVVSGIVQALTLFASSLEGVDDAEFSSVLFETRFQVMNGIGAGLVVLHVILAIVAWRVVRKSSRAVRNTIGFVVMLYWLFGMALFNTIAAETPDRAGIGDRLLFVVLVALVVMAGVGSVFAWTIRRAVRELTSLAPMISRFLPLLLISVLFFFFNAEIWQLASNLSVGRAWAISAVIFGLTIVLIIANKNEDLRRLLARGDASPHQRRPHQDDEAGGRGGQYRPVRPHRRVSIA